MVISVEIKNLDRIEQLIRAIPAEAEKELRKAVNKAEDAAHREALIQITRVYTIKMEAIAKELVGIKASGSSLQAILKSRVVRAGQVILMFIQKILIPIRDGHRDQGILQK